MPGHTQNVFRSSPTSHQRAGEGKNHTKATLQVRLFYIDLQRKNYARPLLQIMLSTVNPTSIDNSKHQK